MKQTPQSTTNPTGDLLFSSDNTPNSNATNDINDIFGFGTGTGSKTQSTNVQPQMNQFPEIFDVKQKETKTHNPFLIDFTNTSAPTTTTATTSQPISGNTSNDLIKSNRTLTFRLKFFK